MIDFVGRGLSCVRGERTVFVGLDFKIEAGGALVLIGANGSGKSSLLRLMAGLARPAAGTIHWAAEDITEDPSVHGARLHYVGHLDAIKPALTVAENLRFWATFRGDRREAAPRTSAALTRFGIAGLADAPARFLSAGQRRRLALARLLCVPASLWLLDEPKTALDVDAAGRLDVAITTHRREGGIVVMSTHGEGLPAGATVLDLGTGIRRGEAPTC